MRLALNSLVLYRLTCLYLLAPYMLLKVYAAPETMEPLRAPKGILEGLRRVSSRPAPLRIEALYGTWQKEVKAGYFTNEVDPKETLDFVPSPFGNLRGHFNVAQCGERPSALSNIKAHLLKPNTRGGDACFSADTSEGKAYMKLLTKNRLEVVRVTYSGEVEKSVYAFRHFAFGVRRLHTPSLEGVWYAEQNRELSSFNEQELCFRYFLYCRAAEGGSVACRIDYMISLPEQPTYFCESDIMSCWSEEGEKPFIKPTACGRSAPCFYIDGYTYLRFLDKDTIEVCVNDLLEGSIDEGKPVCLIRQDRDDMADASESAKRRRSYMPGVYKRLKR